jgi:hypothetical protein
LAIGTPIVIGSHGATSGTPNVITTTANSPAGNLIVVFTSSEISGSGAGIPSDSAANAYAGDAVGIAGANNCFPNYASFSLNLPLGGTITSPFQLSATGNQEVIAISCSGVGGHFDNEGNNNRATGTAPSVTEGTVHNNNRLVLAWLVVEAGSADSFTQSAGFTTLGSIIGGTSILRLAYAIPTTAPALTFAPTLGTSRNYTVGTISFGTAAGKGQITTHTVVAGKGASLRAAQFAIGAHTVIAGHTAAQVQTTGTVATHTAVAGVGLGVKQAAAAITTHTVVAGVGQRLGQAAGRIVTHTAVAGVSAATAASAFQIATATAVEGVGVSIWDWTQTVISQYANSPSMLRLIEAFATDLNQNTNFQAFYDQVWNVDTAVGWGLDVWGRIVGVSRVLTISTEAYFSFQQAHNIGPGDPFGGGPFFSGEDATANFNLSDDAFRQLILAKAAANICDGSIPAINSILMALFSELGNCYCTDDGNMQMTYTFASPLNPVQYAIITQSGVLPKPVGVAASIVQL